MRRADRLFQIVQILRNRRLVTAKMLSERLEVSERTIYRDIQDLSLSGVPVEGEAGVGYTLRHSMDVPPLMFSQDEVQAIVLGARMVSTWGGRELSSAAKSAVEKIEGSLPESLRHLTSQSHLYAFPFEFETEIFDNVDILRQSINNKHVISFKYERKDGQQSERSVDPLALYFWGYVWTLTAWCHLRQSFRNFRIDRMSEIKTTDQQYEALPGQTLEDYIASIDCKNEPPAT